MMIIAAMTIYMAIRSRRFIPIAAFAACPVVAWLTRSDHPEHRRRCHVRPGIETAGVPPLPRPGALGVVLAGAGACRGLRSVVGPQVQVRLPRSLAGSTPRYNSVFMRMTASDAKPFEACEFMRQNQLSGKMFNYWTEGGFIAWGEEPDPDTGQTPLQLFMDGRAQAAYDVDAFDLWTDIMSGGPIARRPPWPATDLTTKDYIEIGNWVSEQLRKENVWVVLMPANQFDKPFVRGLRVQNTEWPIVYPTTSRSSSSTSRLAQGRKLCRGHIHRPDRVSGRIPRAHGPGA